MNGYGGTAAVQIRKSKHIPLATSEAQKAVLSANKREQRLQVAMWQIAWWEGPEHSWQVTHAGSPGGLQRGVSQE